MLRPLAASPLIARVALCMALVSAASAASVERTYQALMGDARIRKALTQIENDQAHTLAEQIQIAEVPAPSFKESARAHDYLHRLQALGFANATIDAEGNVIARRKGSGKGPTLVLSAHLDTVFPEGTDVTVRKEGARYFGKGFTDDSRGLAANLCVLRALQAQKITTVGDILFVATVGEEGLGNLRGAKALFRDNPGIDGFISVDGVMSPRDVQSKRAAIVTQATGSRRWKFVFTGPGGHSFQNFGLPSANHALGRAIARIADLRAPSDPKTTFTVGIVSGGSAVNAIAAEAQMQLDIRSNDAAALAELEGRIMAAVDAGVSDENTRWNSKEMKVTKHLLGDRPTQSASNDTPMVRAAVQAWRALGKPEPILTSASTDSNVAIALAVPALTLDGGGIGDKAHSPDEWYEPQQAWLGPQSVLLTVLALVGVQGVSAPVLALRDAPATGVSH